MSSVKGSFFSKGFAAFEKKLPLPLPFTASTTFIFCELVLFLERNFVTPYLHLNCRIDLILAYF